MVIGNMKVTEEQKKRAKKRLKATKAFKPIPKKILDKMEKRLRTYNNKE